jgi:tetratricopeptide (TPR) repeat protein
MGELHFVTGNRRGLLGQVKARARDTQGCVVAGPDATAGAHDLQKDWVGLAGVALGVINPLAELALAMGNAAVASLQRPPEAPEPGPSDLFGLFDDLVSAAGAEGDTVVFIVDADDRDQDLWNRRFTQYTGRSGRLRRQRLVMVVGLTDAPADPGSVDESFPPLVRDAASLVAEGKAHWHAVPPLTPELVTDLLPVSSETARLLVTVTGGDDHLARDRWQTWVRDGVVRPDESGVWSLTGDPIDHVLVGIERAFDAVFAADRARLDRAHLALMCAALVGEVFCVESVVSTTVFAGEDHDTVEDDLDALIDGDNPGLLAIVGHDTGPPGHQAGHLWRYRFLDPAVATYYRAVADGDPDRERYIQSLITNLIDLRLYGGEFDTEIGRLARELGERSTAQMIEDRIATRQELANLDIDAATLLALAPGWDPSDHYLCEQLITATTRLAQLGLLDRAVACGYTAVALARAHTDASSGLLASALNELGVAHLFRDETGEAIGYLSEAGALAQAAYHSEPTVPNRGHLASTLHQLGVVHTKRGEMKEAIDYLTEALPHNQAVYDNQPTTHHRRNLAATFHQLGAVYGWHEEARKAIDYLAQARSHLQAIYDQEPAQAHRSDLGYTLHALGTVHKQQGETERAIGYLTEARGHRQAIYDNQPTPSHRMNLASTIHELGVVRGLRDEMDEAIGLLTEASVHRQAISDDEPVPAHRANLAASLYALGTVHGRRGEIEEAIGLLTEARAHQQVAYDHEPTPATRGRLAATLAELGVVHGRRGELGEAIGLLTEARGHRQAAYDHEATPANRDNLASVLHALGVTRRERGELGEAIGLLTEARGFLQAAYDHEATPANRDNLASVLHALGVTRREQGELGEAIGLLTEARAHYQAAHDHAPTPSRRRELDQAVDALRNLGGGG